MTTDMDRAGAVERAARALVGYFARPMKQRFGTHKEQARLVNALGRALALSREPHPPAPAGEASAVKDECPRCGSDRRTRFIYTDTSKAIFDACTGPAHHPWHDSPATPAERAAAGGSEEAAGTKRAADGETPAALKHPALARSEAPLWSKEHTIDCDVDRAMGALIMATPDPCPYCGARKQYEPTSGGSNREHAESCALFVALRSMRPSPDAGGVGEAKAAFYEAALAYCRSALDESVSTDDDRPLEQAMYSAYMALRPAAGGGDDPRRGESGEAIKAQGGTL